MNLVRRNLGCLAAGWMAGLCLVLSAGCASSSSQKVYDRYAQLVAQRSQTAAPAAPVAQPDVKSVPPAPAATRPAPPKPAPTAKPPARPETPAAARPAAPERPAPAPAPVQIVAPKPVEKAPAPVQPAAAAAPAPAEPASTADSGYRLKVGDGIQIFLRGIPGGEVIEDIIDEAGMITLPFINEILAAGSSASELERNIRQTYLDQDIYRNITVNVVVPTRFYFIQGEVRAPGRFQIMSATRVSQAIAGAGGYTEFASGKVVVKRKGKIVKEIRNARRLERSPEDDLLLEPDDVVEVLRSWF